MLVPSNESLDVYGLRPWAERDPAPTDLGFAFERVVRRCLYTMRYLLLAPSQSRVGLRGAPHGYTFMPNYTPACEPLDWWSLVPRRLSGCTCSFCVHPSVMK